MLLQPTDATLVVLGAPAPRVLPAVFVLGAFLLGVGQLSGAPSLLMVLAALTVCFVLTLFIASVSEIGLERDALLIVRTRMAREPVVTRIPFADVAHVRLGHEYGHAGDVCVHMNDGKVHRLRFIGNKGRSLYDVQLNATAVEFPKDRRDVVGLARAFSTVLAQCGVVIAQEPLPSTPQFHYGNAEPKRPLE